MIHPFFSAAKPLYKGEGNWWKYILTFLLVMAFYVVGQIPLFIPIIYQVATGVRNPEDFANMTPDAAGLGLSENLFLFLALIMFLFALFGLWLGVRFIHRKAFTSIINSGKKIRWSRFGFGFMLWFAASLIILAVGYAMNPGNFNLQFEPKKFIWLFLIAATLIPFQSSFEELFIRGHIMQGLGWLGKNIWFAVIVSSLLFMAMHMANPEIAEFGRGIMMVYYTMFGVFLALITVFDKGLELAMGIHTANNLFASLFVTFKGSVLQTPAVFEQLEINMGQDLIGGAIVAIAIFFLLAKKYKWTLSGLNNYDWNAPSLSEYQESRNKLA